MGRVRLSPTACMVLQLLINGHKMAYRFLGCVPWIGSLSGIWELDVKQFLSRVKHWGNDNSEKISPGRLARSNPLSECMYLNYHQVQLVAKWFIILPNIVRFWWICYWLLVMNSPIWFNIRCSKSMDSRRGRGQCPPKKDVPQCIICNKRDIENENHFLTSYTLYIKKKVVYSMPKLKKVVILLSCVT